MTYVKEWYYSGRLADSFSWPLKIYPGEESIVLSYERNWSWAGCSGYVTYNIYDTDITIGFSNPAFFDNNTLGVGTGGKEVWENMDNHGYDEFTERIDSSNRMAILNFDFKCTDGAINRCTVNLTAYNNA